MIKGENLGLAGQRLAVYITTPVPRDNTSALQRKPKA